jgi:hypothetical protein
MQEESGCMTERNNKGYSGGEDRVSGYAHWNQPDAVNHAIALRFHSGYRGRVVTDPER